MTGFRRRCLVQEGFGPLALGLAVGAEVLALGFAAVQLAGCAAYVVAGWCGASFVHQTLWRRSSTLRVSPA